MSTILNAQQKQLSDRPYHRPRKKDWKAPLLVALLVIIALLSSFIFFLLNPTIVAEEEELQPAKVVQVEPANEPILPVGHEWSTEPQEKLISPVIFQTKKLPAAADETSSTALNPAGQQQGGGLREEKQVQEEMHEIDYSNVSDELQQRFQRALLMRKDEGRAFIENDNSDGMDLHQMASDFQNQVPAISYQFHVYSSVAKDRWIRINGEDLVEGQFDHSGNIQVVEIQANRTVFRLGSQSFSLQSLTDWKPL